jgi:hypothetical protein
MNVRESEVAVGAAAGEFFVVEADELQPGGVQGVNMHWLFHGLEAEFASPDNQCFIQQPAASGP